MTTWPADPAAPSMDRTPAQMREDAILWSRAGYPATAVGRYRDAADQIERLEKRLAAAEGRERKVIRFAGIPKALDP